VSSSQLQKQLNTFFEIYKYLFYLFFTNYLQKTFKLFQQLIIHNLSTYPQLIHISTTYPQNCYDLKLHKNSDPARLVASVVAPC